MIKKIIIAYVCMSLLGCLSSNIRQNQVKQDKQENSCIMFDIEDPLFIIESDNHKILIELLNDFKVTCLDDFYGISLEDL